MAPLENEPICPASYEITRVLLAGDPSTRPGFWTAYRKEVEYNLKTDYSNYHIHLCRDVLRDLPARFPGPVYFRGGRLVMEKEITPSCVAPRSLLNQPAPSL